MSDQIRIDLLESVARDAEDRTIRITPIEVVDYEPSSDDLTTQFVWPGTIAVIVTPAGSPLQKRLRRAVKARDGSDGQLTKELQAQSNHRRPVPYEKAAEIIRAQDVIADVRYRGATVATTLFVPEDADYCAAVMPYNGGALSAKGFVLVERLRGETRRKLQAVAIRHAPSLSAAEKAALRKVPADQRELNVGTASICYALCLVAVAVLVTLAVVCTYRIRVAEFQAPGDPHIPEEEIRKLGPGATARELIRLRRELMRA